MIAPHCRIHNALDCFFRHRPGFLYQGFGRIDDPLQGIDKFEVFKLLVAGPEQVAEGSMVNLPLEPMRVKITEQRFLL